MITTSVPTQPCPTSPVWLSGEYDSSTLTLEETQVFYSLSLFLSLCCDVQIFPAAAAYRAPNPANIIALLCLFRHILLLTYIHKFIHSRECKYITVNFFWYLKNISMLCYSYVMCISTILQMSSGVWCVWRRGSVMLTSWAA